MTYYEWTTEWYIQEHTDEGSLFAHYWQGYLFAYNISIRSLSVVLYHSFV